MCLPEKCDIHHPFFGSGYFLQQKGLYRKRFLEEVMVALEDETDESQDIRGQCMLQNLKLHPKISNFNFAAVWTALCCLK
jgi:hypothetical protein